jgi:hypothetical protein
MIPHLLRTKKALAAVAVAGGAAIAAVGPSAPAVAFFSPPLLLEIQVVSPATLAAKGAGANVTLKIVCAGASTASVFVTLTERVGKTIASGFGSAQVGCTNGTQTILVEVIAQPGKAYAKGSAIADGNISACSSGQNPVCGSEQDIQTIKLVR